MEFIFIIPDKCPIYYGKSIYYNYFDCEVQNLKKKNDNIIL